jgi:O-antigen/teichoic acid export membrane protein
VTRVASKGRSGAVIRTGLLSLLTRGFSNVASLLTVPLVLHHVGAERYGIWITAIALSSLFTMADGGVTKGLIGEVAKANGEGDRRRIRTLISSAMAATVGFVTVFLAVTFAVIANVDWVWAFNLSSAEGGHEAAAVIATICTCYALSFIPTVVREARLGMLQGATVNAWDFAGLVCSFIGLLIAVKLDLGLVVIAAVWSGTPALARAGATCVFLLGQDRDLWPAWRDIQPAVCRLLIASGSVYMFFALTQALAVQSDQILIARFLGASAVTDYVIVQRLFNMIPVLVTLGLIAQWPAYGDAMGWGDIAWIRRHLTRSLAAYAAGSAAMALLLAVFCGSILRIWVGGTVTAPLTLTVPLAIYAVVAAVGNGFLFFYMSLGMYRRLILSQLVLIAISISFAMTLVPRLGVPGVVIATTCGFLFGLALPGLIQMNSIFASLLDLRGAANHHGDR